MSSALHSLLNPILSPITAVRSKEVQLSQFITNLPSISSQNSKLVKENNLLKIKVKELTATINDQALINSLAKQPWQIQPIRLISLGNFAIFTSANLANIKPGQPVVSDNSIVGIVKSVQAPVIKVIPLNHTEIKIAAELETGAKGDYIYKNNHPFITNLPTNIAFNSKTIVLTLPTELIPENLVIGQIERVTSNPANPTQEATLTLNQEISSSGHFFIITKP